MAMSEQICTLTISLLMQFIQHNYQKLFNSDNDNILLVPRKLTLYTRKTPRGIINLHALNDEDAYRRHGYG